MSLIDELPREFSEWLSSRGTPIKIEKDSVVVDGIRTATWSTFENSLGRAVQINLVEEHEGTWITSITAIWTPDENVLWADVLTELPHNQVGIVNAPRVIRNLLLGGGEPQIGRDSIEVQPREVDDQNALDELMDGLSDEGRSIPYLLMRVGKGTERKLSIQRATRASETLAGLAQVFAVDEKSIKYLNGVLSQAHQLEEVGARLMMPGALNSPWDERLTHFISSVDLDDNQKTLGRMMLRRIGMTSQWPTVPVTWAMLKRECDQKRVELLQEAKSRGASIDTGAIVRPLDSNENAAEIQRLRDQIDYLQEEVLVAAIAAEEEAAKAENFLNALVGRLTSGDPPIHLRMKRQNVLGTIAEARLHVQHVVIPVSAENSIEVLDGSASSETWAGDISQLFAAMEAYAIAVARRTFNGDFLKWCDDGGGYFANKIAMKESEPTMKDPKLKLTRVFPVSTELDVTGMKVMVAHAKIQMRGGGQIPRVYFYDDTKGATKKMHIGFIGPHFLVPTSTF
jgi:hypothetical protein